MDRAFYNLTVRTVSEDQRIIEGIATTPRADRVGDVVESAGVKMSLPLPLLLDHNHAEAVGEVESAQVTPTGIKFRARIKKISEPGPVKDMCDRAWQLIKNGLRKFVSIGFRPLDYEPLGTGGMRYTAWEWLELSCVTVPAHPDAAITGIKASHHGARPCPAGPRDGVVRLDPVVAASLKGTLKINTARKSGLKIIRTGPKVVRLTPEQAPWTVRDYSKTKVVKVTAEDRARAKRHLAHRVVKL